MAFISFTHQKSAQKLVVDWDLSFSHIQNTMELVSKKVMVGSKVTISRQDVRILVI